jgi:hypothetical protein
LIEKKADYFIKTVNPKECVSSFVHFIDKDRLSIHKMGQIYHRSFLQEDEAIALFNKNRFQCFKSIKGNKFEKIRLKSHEAEDVLQVNSPLLSACSGNSKNSDVESFANMMPYNYSTVYIH